MTNRNDFAYHEIMGRLRGQACIFAITLVMGVVWGGLFLTALPAQAALSSCGASVSPAQVLPNGSSEFRVDVTNSDSVRIKWIRVIKPFGGLTTTDVSLYRWEKYYSAEGSDLVVTDERDLYPLNPGGSLYLTVTIQVGDILGSSGDWVVMASDEVSGANPITCGSSNLTVTADAPEVEPPQLSDVAVREISDHSAIVEWITDENSTSIVRYGVMADWGEYPFSASSEEMVTNHSVSLTASIAASTTYYFQICSTDKWGNEGCSNELSFTSSAAGEVVTETIIQTVTSVVQSRAEVKTETKTVTILVRDTESPKVWFSSEAADYYGERPAITGTASDNTMVVSVDYSVDGGKSWRPVSIKGRQKSERFEVELPLTEEGNYTIYLRAFDAEGNRGTAGPREIVIDRFPPVIGGVQFLWGSQLIRSLRGKIVTALGVPMRIVARSAGGTTQLKLTGGTEELEMQQDKVSGRWTQTMSFSSPGVHQLQLAAVDGFDRMTETKVAEVEVITAGSIQSESGEAVPAWLTVYAKKMLTGRFELWDGRAYQIENPVFVDKDQAAAIALPAGTYYFEIGAEGYVSKKTEMIELDQPGLLTTGARLRPEKRWQLWGKQLVLPQLPSELAPLERVLLNEESVDEFEQRRGEVMPPVALLTETGSTIHPSDWLGKTVLLAVESLWQPSVSQTVDYLQGAKTAFPGVTTVWVTPLSRLETLQGMRARAGSGVDVIVSDEAGGLLETFATHELPFFVLIGPDGKILQLSHQVFSGQVLEEYGSSRN